MSKKEIRLLTHMSGWPTENMDGLTYGEGVRIGSDNGPSVVFRNQMYMYDSIYGDVMQLIGCQVTKIDNVGFKVGQAIVAHGHIILNSVDHYKNKSVWKTNDPIGVYELLADPKYPHDGGMMAASTGE